MVTSPNLKTLHPLQVFSTKLPFSSSSASSSPSSTLSSMKIKTLIHTLIVSHVCRIVRSLSKAKSILIQILKEIRQPLHMIYLIKATKRKQKNKKIFFGSFRLHYNWCSVHSSHVLPVASPVLEECTLYYDSCWNSVIPSATTTTADHAQEHLSHDHYSQLSGYLQWLEEKVSASGVNGGEGDNNHGVNDIDRLADIFIASCHEKFILEKQESYRRFQEMMARSL